MGFLFEFFPIVDEETGKFSTSSLQVMFSECIDHYCSLFKDSFSSFLSLIPKTECNVPAGI